MHAGFLQASKGGTAPIRVLSGKSFELNQNGGVFLVQMREISSREAHDPF